MSVKVEKPPPAPNKKPKKKNTMQLENITKEQQATLAKVVTSHTGSLIPLKKYATQEGFDLSDKEQRKTANALYSRHKKAFYAEGKAMASYLTTLNLNVTKCHRILDESGEVKSAKLTFRAPTKSEVKGEKQTALAIAQAEIAELKAKLQALSVN